MLLAAWAGGDNESGDRLVKRHFRAIYRFFRGKLADDVDDLTQRTFTACLAAADRFRGDTSMRGFLLAIARKQLLGHLRTAYRREKVFDPATLSVQDVADAARSMGTVMVAEESERLLLTALRRIPIDFQITIELYYWEELPIAEIAQVLEIAPGTVKSRLGRARAMLREQIGQVAQSPAIAQTTMGDLDRCTKSLGDKL